MLELEFAVCKIYDKMNKIYGRIDEWINENQYVERKNTRAQTICSQHASWHLYTPFIITIVE